MKAPANVEAVISDDPKNRTLRIHLIAYNPTPQTTPAKDRPLILPCLIEDAPIYRVQLHINGDFEKVTSFNESTSIQRDGQQVDLLIEDIHDVIRVHY